MPSVRNYFYWFDQIKPESDAAWADAAVTIAGMLYWTSGEAPEDTCWDPFDPSRGLLRPAPVAPRTIDPAYVADAIASFMRTGFHGALNYYRTVDPFTRNWAAFAGARIAQPSMFLAGTLDGLNKVASPNREAMGNDLTDLRSVVLLDGIGHWPQLEAPDATNAALLAFLHDL